jgi:chlorophyll/bacteriochlorophyll a synthase
MNRSLLPAAVSARPSMPAILEVSHPITWFPPMWAFACGVVSSGAPVLQQWWLLVAGVLLAGPLMCGTSQVVNDWYDRHVDAINEPNRPIPSGRIPGRWGLYLALIWTTLSLLLAWLLGPWVFGAALLGMALAWAYSAPPFRLKGNGWWGNLAVGFSYEGLAWVTGAAVMLGGAMPDWRILALAVLYSLGAHGIMTLNDFKAIEGDKQMNVRSLPVQLGVDGAARLASLVMAVPQAIVIALLFAWDKPAHGIAVGILLLIQLLLMIRFLQNPRERATWFSGLGVSVYVTGMMVSAFAVRGLLA